MKATIIIAAAVALVLVALVVSLLNRAEGTYNMLDRWTGQVWKCVAREHPSRNANQVRKGL